MTTRQMQYLKRSDANASIDEENSIVDIPTSAFLNVSFEKGLNTGGISTTFEQPQAAKEATTLGSPLNKEHQWYAKKPVKAQMGQSNNAKIDHFESLQKWEGYIVAIYGKSIVARLKDITNGGTDEEAELTLSDISEDDKSLVKEGAIFYWNLGYQTIKGTRTKASIIRFRRLPSVSPFRHNQIAQQAQEAFNLIHWE